MKQLLFALPVLGLMTMTNAMAQHKTHSGIQLKNLDKSASPEENFYQFTCGGWMANNPMPNEYSRFGSFDKLAADNQERLKDVVLEIAAKQNAKGSVGDKVATLYNMGMNTDKLEQQGATPIAPELHAIVGLKDRSSLMAHIGTMHRNGTFPFFNLFGEADPTNSSIKIAWTYQGGLGMGEREYYFAEGKDADNLRKAYVKLMETQFKNAQLDKMLKRKPAELAKAVFAIEKQLAAQSLRPEDLRDPLAQVNIKTVEEFGKIIAPLDAKQYLGALGLTIAHINLPQEKFLQEVGKILEHTAMEDLKAYLAWEVINGAAAYLNGAFEQANFAFYGAAMSGTKEMKPRWKRVLNTVNGCLGEAVGEVYVNKYFPKEAKTHMEHLVKNLQVALASRISKLEWMSAETKMKALEKLTTFHVKIGYPNTWKDYSNLTIADDSYYANVRRASIFEMTDMLQKIGKPVDKDQWLMTPQTVNAYYNPTTNEICFPAAILQPPFFDMSADDAMNYGAIGVVIGHEMTHGFDDQGRLYDKDGNVNNWWSDTDAKNFTARADILVNHFNNIEVAPGVHANGKLTLGENIADNGGLQVSYEAMQMAIKEGEKIAPSIDGFDADQRFFIAYSTVWASNIRPQEVLRLTKEDPHSLGKWRVNGTLPHIDTFLKAFQVKEGHAMWLAPEKRAIIW